MTPLDLATHLFGSDPSWSNRDLWDDHCVHCGRSLIGRSFVAAVVSLCEACCKERNFQWRAP